MHTILRVCVVLVILRRVGVAAAGARRDGRSWDRFFGLIGTAVEFVGIAVLQYRLGGRGVYERDESKSARFSGVVFLQRYFDHTTIFGKEI